MRAPSSGRKISWAETRAGSNKFQATFHRNGNTLTAVRHTHDAERRVGEREGTSVSDRERE